MKWLFHSIIVLLIIEKPSPMIRRDHPWWSRAMFIEARVLNGLVELWEGAVLIFAILLRCEITTLFV